MVERALGRDVAPAFADDHRQLALEVEIVRELGRIISPSWPTRVSVKRMNMLGCFGNSRPISAACER